MVIMFTFIRIPKSGSTSLMVSIGASDPNFNHRHRTVKEILQDGKDHKFYTMVRDPLEQYCSMYYYAKDMIGLDIKENPMMEAFIDHVEAVKKYPDLEEYLLHAPPNAFLEKYLSGLNPEELVCVGRLDRFEESLELITKIIGIPTLNVWLKRNYKNIPYTVSESTKSIFIKNNEHEYMLYNKSLLYFNKLRNYFF